ncbi:helix-turn-helix transcriptional regulator [Paraburkholderia phosphatilytica]|uniref:helix-turn-helix transcriptional regulator n=1 Tax=Paraburkholderia phosphatilytica TaxID=2282883 RepID=UPI000E50798B|nr:YafY family protein [Paraburkholderia phosphatilytica]
MSRPTTRVLAVLELLQTHGQLSGSELARRLDVDARTLRRYITALEELGIPITAERGRYGGYALIAGYRLPPMMFSQPEAMAVSIGLVAARRMGLGDASAAVASAQAKLERVMPAQLKRQVRALSENATLHAPNAASQGNPELLMMLASATQAQQRVRFNYHDLHGDATRRDADPYGLVYRNGRWYMSGMCRLRDALRTFRLDRMDNIETLDTTFERPEGFSADGYLSHSIATLRRRYTVEVRLHTSLQQAMLELREDMGLLAPLEDGLRLSAHTDSLEWFARELARLSFGFEILEPLELRDAVREFATHLLKQVDR